MCECSRGMYEATYHPSWQQSPRIMVKSAPKGVVIKASTKGYINDRIFYEWGKLFIENLKSLGLDNGHNILTFDGHGSHIYNLPLINELHSNNISTVTFEPHTTHATQWISTHLQYSRDSICIV